MQSHFLSKSAYILKIALIIFLCGNTTPKKVIKVEAYPLQKISFHEEYTAVGECILDNSKDFTAKVNGRIDTLNIVEGKNVKEGDILLSLDSAAANAAKQRAEIALNNAQKEYDKSLNLFKKGLISETLLDDAWSRLCDRKAEFERNYLDYKGMIIKAPSDGRIGAIYVKIGDEIQANKSLFSFITNNSKKTIVLDLPENMYKKIDYDSQVYTLDINNKKIEGKITALAACLTQNGAWQVRVTFPESCHLLHKSYVPVTFIYNQHTGFGIEDKIVQRNNTGSYIYKIVENKANRVYIKTSTRLNGFVEIISDNLNIKDLIITKGLTNIEDEICVEVVNESSSHEK